MPDGAYTLIGIVAAALLAWYLSRRRDASESYQAQSAGDLAYADIADRAWKESAKLREALGLAESALARAEEGRKKDRAVTKKRFELITPLMEKCLDSHPELEKDFAEFKALQWTEGLNGGAT